MLQQPLHPAPLAWVGGQHGGARRQGPRLALVDAVVRAEELQVGEERQQHLAVVHEPVVAAHLEPRDDLARGVARVAVALGPPGPPDAERRLQLLQQLGEPLPREVVAALGALLLDDLLGAFLGAPWKKY